MDHSLKIRRRGDGSIDTSHYVDYGNRLHAEAIMHSLDTLGHWAHALVASISNARRPGTSKRKLPLFWEP